MDVDGTSRRMALDRVVWAGVLETVSGGRPCSALPGGAAAEAQTDLSFVQINDSHPRFAHPPNMDTSGTLRDAAAPLNQQKGRAAGGIFPNEDAATKLAGAVLLQANDERKLRHCIMQTKALARLTLPTIDAVLTQAAIAAE